LLAAFSLDKCGGLYGRGPFGKDFASITHETFQGSGDKRMCWYRTSFRVIVLATKPATRAVRRLRHARMIAEVPSAHADRELRHTAGSFSAIASRFSVPPLCFFRGRLLISIQR
jgi:hypothetical protein